MNAGFEKEATLLFELEAHASILSMPTVGTGVLLAGGGTFGPGDDCRVQMKSVCMYVVILTSGGSIVGGSGVTAHGLPRHFSWPRVQ